MKQYKVQITDKALADMEAIYEYIAAVLGAPETAMKQSDFGNSLATKNQIAESL